MDEACNKKFPTFIDSKNYWFWPQQQELNNIKSAQIYIAYEHETFTVIYTSKDDATV